MKEGWTYRKLGEVCDFEGGSQPPKSEWINQPLQGYVRMLQIRDFTKSRESQIEYVKKSKKLRLCKADDILIGRYGASVGKILTGLDGAYNVAIIKSIPFEDIISKEFIRRYFESSSFQKLLFKVCDTRTAQAGFSKDDIKDALVPIPSIEEQKRIVVRLDAAFAHIDELKANAEKQLTEAPALFQNCLTKAMEPKEGWEEKKLEDICTNIIDCPHSTPRKVDYPTQYPCIRTSELKGGKIEWKSMQYLDEEEYNIRTSRIKPQPNDIVYGREGTYGDAVLLPEGYFFSLGQRTMLFRPDVDRVIPQFLLYSVISSHVYEQAKAKNSGCGVGHVNVKDIKLFNIGVPKSLSEQQRIVARLDSLSENIRKYEEIQRKVISECDALKQALLRKVFE